MENNYPGASNIKRTQMLTQKERGFLKVLLLTACLSKSTSCNPHVGQLEITKREQNRFYKKDRFNQLFFEDIDMMQDIPVLVKDEMKPIRCYGTSFFKICCSEYLITLWFLTIQSIDYSSTPQTKSLSWSLHQESLNQMEFAKNVTKLQRSKGHFSGSLRRRVMKDDTVRNAKTGKDAPGAFSWVVWRRAMPCSLIG